MDGLAAASVSLVAPVLLIAGTAQAATPVAVWHMEDPGTMTDRSGNNNGTTAGITSVPGSTGSGYHFAPNSSVTVPDSASLNPGTADFSVSTQVRFDTPPDAATVDYDLIRKGLTTAAGGEWKIEIFPNSTLTSPAFCLFKDAGGTTSSIRGRTNLADGAWHTITCAKTSTQISLTVDGATQNKAVALGSISNNQPVGLGQKPGGGDQHVGDMDEVRIEIGSTSPVDTTAPTVTGTSPADGATGVPASTNVTATFSEPVQGVSGSTFTLTPAGGAVPASVTPGTGNQYILDPTADLAAGVTYTATLSGSITDTSNNAFAGASWTFTTAAAPADTTPPTVTATTPADGATGVAASTNVTATFSEPVQGVSGSTFTLTSAGGAVPASVTPGTGNQYILDPTADLAAGVTYTATLSGSITDTSNNAFAGASWTFTTAAAPADTTPPTVTATTPADGATGVAASTNVTATFSEPVQGVSGSTFTLTSAGGAVPASVTPGTGNQYILDPTADLAAGVTYTATLSGSITDTSNNAFAGASWTFTTAAAPADTTPPTVTATTPADGATGVAASTNVTATFSEPVQGVSGSTFTLTSAGGAVPASVTQGTGNQYILDPTADLAAGVTYTATLSGSITDTSKNAFAGTSWTFTTAAAPADTTPPTVTATTPADGATGVAASTNVTATFSEPVQGVSGSTFTLT